MAKLMSCVWLGLALGVLAMLAQCVSASATSDGRSPVPPVPPDWSKKAQTARWLVHEASYGVISTISLHLKGAPFGNVQSFADGTVDNSTGNIYFFASPFDTSWHDLAADSRCSFTISEQQTVGGWCSNHTEDPEDPRCARLTLSGTMVDINATAWGGPVETALFSRHPEMKEWVNSGDHNFGFYQMDIANIWLVDFFGGAADISPKDYFLANPSRGSAKK